jgi:hypothetical protein
MVYETFGMPVSSKARMMKKMSKVNKWEKDSGSAHLSISINKKVLDGKEICTISVNKCDAKTQEFTSVDTFANFIKETISGIKAQL